MAVPDRLRSGSGSGLAEEGTFAPKSPPGLRILPHRFQISNNCLCVRFVHTERHHGQAQRPSIRPDSGRQQLHQVLIASWRIPANSRRLQWPIWIGARRLKEFWSSIECTIGIELSIAQSRCVTLRTHGNVLDDVPASFDFVRRARNRHRRRPVTFLLRTRRRLDPHCGPKKNQRKKNHRQDKAPSSAKASRCESVTFWLVHANPPKQLPLSKGKGNP